LNFAFILYFALYISLDNCPNGTNNSITRFGEEIQHLYPQQEDRTINIGSPLETTNNNNNNNIRREIPESISNSRHESRSQTELPTYEQIVSEEEMPPQYSQAIINNSVNIYYELV